MSRLESDQLIAYIIGSSVCGVRKQLKTYLQIVGVQESNL